jgi:hypothetical protein
MALLWACVPSENYLQWKGTILVLCPLKHLPAAHADRVFFLFLLFFLIFRISTGSAESEKYIASLHTGSDAMKRLDAAETTTYVWLATPSSRY